ncbi:DUF7313 family protein [Halobellus ruber]|uniref:DUF7313 domain-containing protein n=1 Tax=Halobellus ruber TaxID=2761102 RepID=A0A7J9SFQ9_9EURY|nr:hypothetical protein [Halobellus ruber]MBB6645804.1 hypothetical protein [Halobellus ruber]
MQPLQFLVPIGALEAVAPVLPFVILAFAVGNMITRIIQHSRHESQAAAGDDDEALSRWPPHTATNLGLVLSSLVYLIVEPHGGMVMSVLALSVFVSDFFEYESRCVEARSKSKDLDRPVAAIGASVFALLYAGYQSLFFVIEPLWNAVV